MHCPHQILTINSADRFSGTSSAFLIQLQTKYFYKKIELLYAGIPSSAYTINGNNNVIYFNEVAAPGIYATAQTIIIPGFYDSTSFPAAVQTALNAVAAQPVTVTYSNITGRLTFAASPGRFISFNFGSNTLSSAGTILGFGNVDIGFSNTRTSTNLIDLSGEKLIFMQISECSANIASNTVGTIASFVIPTSSTSQGFNTYRQNNDYNMVSESTGLDSLSIRLKKIDNTTLDLNNVDWVCILRLCS